MTSSHGDDPAFPADASAFLVIAASSGLPLTSQEARNVVEWHTMSADHYAPWPYWDAWAPSVPDGTLPYEPSRNATEGWMIRVPELAYVIEYCQSPHLNAASAPFVDCEVVRDPTRWGQ